MTAPTGQPVPTGELTDHEKMTAMVRAAKTYDHDNRPRGNWSSVPDNQVGRLIIGALSVMEFAHEPRKLEIAMEALQDIQAGQAGPHRAARALALIAAEDHPASGAHQ